MLKLKGIIKPEEIIKFVIRRRWFIIIPFCLSMLVGIFLGFTLPRVYKAETLILVQPQKVPQNYIRSVVSSDFDSRLGTIKQQVMSRTNIEMIINRFNLFSKPEHKKIYLEDKIENVKKRISLRVTRAGRGADAFAISFTGQDPQKVMNITNTLATYFIDENLRVREAQAIGTSEFIDNERNSMQKRLEGVEENLRKYRKIHMGELPEQLETNLRILDRLQVEMNEKQQRLSEIRSRLIVFENQMSDRHVLLTSNGITQFETENSTNLEQLKKGLADLKTRYTDRHPDVVRLTGKIAALEGENEKRSEDTVGESSDSGASTNITGLSATNIRQIEEIKREIKSLAIGISELNHQSKIYQKRVENTPKREQELMSLRRDYQNIQSVYNSLLNRKLEAEIAVNMEKKQKGEQFRIVDFATLPEKPVAPNMKSLFVLSLAAGLGFGCGFIFLLYYLDTSFRCHEDIESFLGIHVIATCPTIYHPKDIRKQKINQFLSAFFIMISCILFAGFAIISFQGVEQTMDFVGRFIAL